MGIFVILRIGLIINDMGYIIKKRIIKCINWRVVWVWKWLIFFSIIKIVDYISYDKLNVLLIN